MRRTLAALVLLATAAAGCGSEAKDPAPNAWAAAVCSQVVSWEDRVTSLATEFESKMEDLGADLTAARAEVVGFLDQIMQRTDQMIDAVAQAGAPETEQGGEIADGLQAGLDRASDAFSQARTKAENLPVTSAADFEQGGEDLAADLVAAGETVQDELTSLGRRFDNASVDAAFANEPDCQAVATIGDVRAEEWAGEVCGQIAAWQQELRSLLGGLRTNTSEATPDQATARAAIVDFMTKAVAATDRLIEAAEHAGAPDTAQGDQIAEDLQEGLREVRQSFEQGRANAEGLAVDDPEAFRAGAAKVTENVGQAASQFQTALRELRATYTGAELNQAFAAAPACQQVLG